MKPSLVINVLMKTRNISQIFASVVLENQTEKGKSVFKRMKIADTSSLAPCEAPLRCKIKLNLFCVYYP